LVIADFDMQNFFNTVEWQEIRSSLSRHFPEALDTVNWEQAQPGVTVLDDGTEFPFDRGAEQGEPFGLVKASLPLGDALERVEGRAESPQKVCQRWYMDDGVLVCSPKDFSPWLRVFDEEIQKIGVTRGSGQDVKSEAKLVCKSGEEHLLSGWDTG